VPGNTSDELTPSGRKLMLELAALKSKPFVKVGVLQEDFAKQKDERKSGKGMTTLGIVAVANEYGTEGADPSDVIFADGGQSHGIPERSFMRSTVDAKANGEWRQAGEEERKAIVSGSRTADAALGRMGQRIKRDIQEKIRSMVPPPNAPSTTKAKGSDKTLIDTAQMLNSMDYEVHRNGGGIGD
jgi:hypothetical protein